MQSLKTLAIVGRLCAGGEIVFRLLVTAAECRNKCSLFILLSNVIRQAETEAD